MKNICCVYIFIYKKSRIRKRKTVAKEEIVTMKSRHKNSVQESRLFIIKKLGFEYLS